MKINHETIPIDIPIENVIKIETYTYFHVNEEVRLIKKSRSSTKQTIFNRMKKKSTWHVVNVAESSLKVHHFRGHRGVKDS